MLISSSLHLINLLCAVSLHISVNDLNSVTVLLITLFVAMSLLSSSLSLTAQLMNHKFSFLFIFHAEHEKFWLLTDHDLNRTMFTLQSESLSSIYTNSYIYIERFFSDFLFITVLRCQLWSQLICSFFTFYDSVFDH